MRALPLVLAFALAAPMARPLLRTLRAGGHVRPNYRGRELPVPLGALIVIAALLALIPLVTIERLAHTTILYPRVLPVTVYVLGVACLGLIDDVLGGARPDGAPAPRGWRGHAAAAVRGELSTGAVKALGSLGLALLAMSYLGLPVGHWLLASAVLVLATNALNLLDLRPGRAIKALVLLGASLTIAAGTRALWTLGLFVGPALVAGAYDLREQAMLGDTGAGLLGALAGLWMVLTLPATGQLIALVLLTIMTVYGELRSISELVVRVPLLRELDSLGRPSSPQR